MSSPSNTQIPVYYDQFRRDVMRGRIPVCLEISQEMNRIDARIADPDIYYDPEPVEGFIRFCEHELTKTDGSDLKLLDSFKLWAEQLFGWWYYATRSVHKVDSDGQGYFVEEEYLKRLINKQYLVVARGAAKTMYVSFIQAYFLVIDGETTHQITTAPTMKQAEETLSPIRTAIIRSVGPLFRFLTVKTKTERTITSGPREMLASTKRGIESYITGSVLEIRPMSIAKLQGLRPKVSTVDEWLSGDIREDVVGAIEQGASKLDDYIIICTSSEGTVRNGSGDSIKMELQAILNGEYDDPHTSIFIYKMDKIEEISNPSLWVKANPNIGLTVSYEAYERDVDRATKVPSARNDILAKRFGIPMEGFTYFFTYEEIIPHRRRTYNSMVCALGADLSQGDDFCSFAFLFPLRGPGFGVKTLNFISERTFRLLQPAARAKYEEFIAEGSLIVMDGTVLNMSDVYFILEEEVQAHGYEILTFGYDPYNSEAFIKLYVSDYSGFGVEVVRQGVRTESVPLGELKALAEDRLLFFDQRIVQYAMGNAMVIEDTNGNRKLYKRRYEAKIDPVAAMMDAYVAFVRNRELFE